MSTGEVDAVVLSACVQMPSLPSVPRVAALTGKPVVTAAVATTYAMLKALNLKPFAPGAAALLSGAYWRRQRGDHDDQHYTARRPRARHRHSTAISSVRRRAAPGRPRSRDPETRGQQQ